MTSEQEHHEELVSGFYNQLKEIFDSSEQAIYLYLDDNHKVCNKKFAQMQGFSSPEEWAKVDNLLKQVLRNLVRMPLFLHTKTLWRN